MAVNAPTTVFAACDASPVSGSPVRFAAEPPLGVPSAPPLTTTAPAEPILTPSAVMTPVPGAVVARAVKAVPPVLVQVKAPVLASVQSPEAVTHVGTTEPFSTRNCPLVPGVKPDTVVPFAA